MDRYKSMRRPDDQAAFPPCEVCETTFMRVCFLMDAKNTTHIACEFCARMMTRCAKGECLQCGFFPVFPAMASYPFCSLEHVSNLKLAKRIVDTSIALPAKGGHYALGTRTVPRT